MKMNQYLAIGEETSEESLSFIGYGLNIQPGFQWRYLKQKYSLGLFLGYELAITKPFFVKGHYDTKLGISSNNLTKPDWSGLRTGVEICYKFGN